jgi:hypothetical protein
MDTWLLALQDRTIQVQIGSAHWYENPGWIVLAVLAAIVVLLLIVAAVRSSGGSPTIRS